MSEVSSLSSQSKTFIKFSLNQNLAKSMGQISKCLLGFYSVRTKANFYWVGAYSRQDSRNSENPVRWLKRNLKFYPQYLLLSKMRKMGYLHHRKPSEMCSCQKTFAKTLVLPSAPFSPVLLLTHITPSFHPFLQHEQIFFTFPNSFSG